MNVIVLGCGRVGSELASLLDSHEHSVTVLDVSQSSFMKLPQSFKGRALLGNGLDPETLIKAGIDKAEAFIAVTQNDNKNIMAAEIAKHIFGVPHVLCRTYDPNRSEVFEASGIITLSPTLLIAGLFVDALLDSVKEAE